MKHHLAIVSAKLKCPYSSAACRGVFGYHLLQIGCANFPMYENSPVGHKFSITHNDNLAGHGIAARGEAIPLTSESVDVVLLHHALDYSSFQHQLLREVSRVLIAGGHIVIVGFNPVSSWGLRTRFPGGKSPPLEWQAFKYFTYFRLVEITGFSD